MRNVAIALVLILLLTSTAHAQTSYDASRAVLYSGVAFDAATTEFALRRGYREANPIVGNNPWQRHTVTVGSALITDWLTGRLRARGHTRAATVLNFTLGSFRWGVGVRNAGL